MNTIQQRRETLNRLLLRAERMKRIARQDPPDLLAVREAMLILSAAAELSPAETKRELAEWLAANPKVAPDGGALFDLRCATVDEASELLSCELNELGLEAWTPQLTDSLATLKAPHQ